MQHLQKALQSIEFDTINPLPGEYIGLCRIPSAEGCVEFVKLEAGSYQPHIHDTIDAHLTILTGKGRIILNGAPYPFHPGSTFEVPRGASHGFTIETCTILLSVQDKPILDKETNEADIRIA
ncbi:MAG: cupin domain-containing protein [Phaeodactylibacter sp.]|nr:cupin domain-containing protein [Phaeodactylibacter sp.]